MASYQLARAGIGGSYQITNAFPNLTIFENMRIAAQPPGWISNSGFIVSSYGRSFRPKPTEYSIWWIY